MEYLFNDVGRQLRIPDGSGYRTFEEQDALYAKGRTAPGNKVTPLRGGESYHNYGLGFDVAPLNSDGKSANYKIDLAPFGTVAKEHGFEWGGNFKSHYDPLHYQRTYGYDADQLRRMMEQSGKYPTVPGQRNRRHFMKVITVVALMVAMHMPPAFGCSTDMLKKISEDHLDRLPSGAQHDFIDPANSQQGGTWQMFVGENGLPHSLVVAWLGEIGQTRLRISFLSRRDFVIAETRINFTEPVSAQDHTGKFEVQPPRHYFFCNRKLQGVADAKTAESANRWKNWFFEEADMLKPELQRIPE